MAAASLSLSLSRWDSWPQCLSFQYFHYKSASGAFFMSRDGINNKAGPRGRSSHTNAIQPIHLALADSPSPGPSSPSPFLLRCSSLAFMTATSISECQIEIIRDIIVSEEERKKAPTRARVRIRDA